MKFKRKFRISQFFCYSKPYLAISRCLYIEQLTKGPRLSGNIIHHKYVDVISNCISKSVAVHQVMYRALIVSFSAAQTFMITSSVSKEDEKDRFLGKKFNFTIVPC